MSVPMMASGYTCIRHFLCFINLLFWILGSCVLGIGIWLTISYDTYARILPSYHILSADNLAIIVGCLTFFVAFCGCCGAWFQNKCLLTTYLVSIVVLMVLEITVGTLSFAFRKQLTRTLREELLDGIQNKYLLDDSNGVRSTWDQIQINFNCCGVNNYTDWHSIKAWPDSHFVPTSCCIPDTNRTKEFDSEDLTVEECGRNSDNELSGYRHHGCYNKIRHFVLNNLHVVGLTSIAVAFIQFFAIVAALLLVCTMDYKKRSRSVFHNHNSRPTYNRVPTL